MNLNCSGQWLRRLIEDRTEEEREVSSPASFRAAIWQGVRRRGHRPGDRQDRGAGPDGGCRRGRAEAVCGTAGAGGAAGVCGVRPEPARSAVQFLGSTLLCSSRICSTFSQDGKSDQLSLHPPTQQPHTPQKLKPLLPVAACSVSFRTTPNAPHTSPLTVSS